MRGVLFTCLGVAIGLAAALLVELPSMRAMCVRQGARELRPTNAKNDDNAPSLERDAHGNATNDHAPSLESLMAASGSDKARKGNGAKGHHGYTRYYERVLEPLRRAPVRFVEIGVEKGRSMRAWQRYFARADHLYGVGYGNFQTAPSQDCSSDNATRVGGAGQTRVGCTIFMGDQSRPEFLRRFVDKTGGRFDVIVDDGSHVPSHVLISFETLWPSVNPGGMYIVEDIESNWWKSSESAYGYSLKNETSVVDKWRGLVDAVNREFTHGRSPLTDENAVYKSIASVEFGQNIIIFYKALQGEKWFLDKPYRWEKRLKPYPFQDAVKGQRRAPKRGG